MLEISLKEHAIKQNKAIIRKLPAVGRSRSHLMADRSPRCMAIVRIEYQNEGYYLLEMDTSDGRASIATKIISARSLALKGQLRDFISEIDQGLLSKQFSWPKTYFDELVGEGNHKSVSHQPSKDKGKLIEEKVERWAERIQINLASRL